MGVLSSLYIGLMARSISSCGWDYRKIVGLNGFWAQTKTPYNYILGEYLRKRVMRKAILPLLCMVWKAQRRRHHNSCGHSVWPIKASETATKFRSVWEISLAWLKILYKPNSDTRHKAPLPCLVPPQAPGTVYWISLIWTKIHLLNRRSRCA